jgi:hypothetical protein
MSVCARACSNSSTGFLTDMIPKMDELTRPGMPLATVLEFDELLDSSDMYMPAAPSFNNKL